MPSPYSEPAGVAFIERQWSRATTRAGYAFVIVTSDDRPVGQVGLWLRDLEQGRASLGYWVVNSARGQGAAVAAVDAVVGWALRDLRIPRLELWVDEHRDQPRLPVTVPRRNDNSFSTQLSGTMSGAPSLAASAVRSSGWSWDSRSASTRFS